MSDLKAANYLGFLRLIISSHLFEIVIVPTSVFVFAALACNGTFLQGGRQEQLAVVVVLWPTKIIFGVL